MRDDMSAVLTLRRALSALDIFRLLYPEVPLVTAEVFLVVALTPACTSRELQSRLGLSQSAVSRHLSILSDFTWNGKPGMDLIDLVEDPEDRRFKVAFLKYRGKQVATQLATALAPDAGQPEPADFPTATEYVAATRRRITGAR